MTLLPLFPRLPPVYVIHFVTHRCNLSCEFCCDGHNRQARQDLDLEQIEIFYRKLLAAQLSITGGEPTLRADLAGILRAALRSSVHSVSLNTNGFLSDRLEGTLRDVLEDSARQSLKVNISIDGFRETHDRMRGINGSFQAALASCERLSKLGTRFPGLSLRVNTVVTKDNAPELPEFRAFIRFRLPRLSDHVFSLERTPPGGSVDPGVLAAYRQLTQSSIADRGFFPKQALLKRLHSRMYDEIATFASGGGGRFECPAGGALAEVTASGEVLGCEVLPKERALLGRLAEHDFDLSSVLRSAAAAEFRERISRERCACSFECAHLTAATLAPMKLAW